MVVCFTHCISLEKGLPSSIYLAAPWMLRQHFYDAVHILAMFGSKVGSEIANFRDNHLKLQQGIFENTPALAMLVTEGRAL